MTQEQLEDKKEEEIDNLLEFAYELDYEKYMEDFEVRQVFSIIKDRVNEIKQDQDWKEKIAEEWNQAGDINNQGGDKQADTKSQIQPQADQQSVYSYSKFLNAFQSLIIFILI